MDFILKFISHVTAALEILKYYAFCFVTFGKLYKFWCFFRHNSDSLSWHLVPLLARTSPPLNGLDDGTVCRDVCIKLCVAPRTKLGLG